MTRQQVIQNFLNDDVQKVCQSLYVWRRRYYEVLPYSFILKSKKTKPDHFIKWIFGNKLYGIREMSKALLKKYYGLDK